MTDGLLHGGRDELEALFSELADELQAVDATLDVLMVGGSWLLWFGERQATRDVDSAKRLSATAAAAIARVAERHDLDPDWVNDHAAPFLPLGFDAASCTTVLRRQTLTVRTPPADTIFLMKLYRASVQDREDMIRLWARCAFVDAVDAAQRFEGAYPHAPDDPYLVEYLESIIRHAQR